jgi:hypothetical protein
MKAIYVFYGQEMTKEQIALNIFFTITFIIMFIIFIVNILQLLGIIPSYISYRQIK